MVGARDVRRAAPVTDARRILVYGVTGSGKTTLARRVGEATAIPWHSIDDEVGWLPDWVEREADDQRRIVTQIVAGEQWVLDTAYGKWVDLVLPRVQLIIALDYPRRVSLVRLLRRTVRRAVTGEEACNGNSESWRMMFSNDSIIAWHFRSFTRKRERISQWEAAAETRPVMRMRSPRETERWLATLRERDC